jgi:hypothetical protein
MEALFYQTQDLNLPAIAQALVLEYRAKGYEAQQFGEKHHFYPGESPQRTQNRITTAVPDCLE